MTRDTMDLKTRMGQLPPPNPDGFVRGLLWGDKMKPYLSDLFEGWLERATPYYTGPDDDELSTTDLHDIPVSERTWAACQWCLETYMRGLVHVMTKGTAGMARSRDETEHEMSRGLLTPDGRIPPDKVWPAWEATVVNMYYELICAIPIEHRDARMARQVFNTCTIRPRSVGHVPSFIKLYETLVMVHSEPPHGIPRIGSFLVSMLELFPAEATADTIHDTLIPYMVNEVLVPSFGHYWSAKGAGHDDTAEVVVEVEVRETALLMALRDITKLVARLPLRYRTADLMARVTLYETFMQAGNETERDVFVALMSSRMILELLALFTNRACVASEVYQYLLRTYIGRTIRAPGEYELRSWIDNQSPLMLRGQVGQVLHTLHALNADELDELNSTISDRDEYGPPASEWGAGRIRTLMHTLDTRYDWALRGLVDIPLYTGVYCIFVRRTRRGWWVPSWALSLCGSARLSNMSHGAGAVVEHIGVLPSDWISPYVSDTFESASDILPEMMQELMGRFQVHYDAMSGSSFDTLPTEPDPDDADAVWEYILDALSLFAGGYAKTHLFLILERLLYTDAGYEQIVAELRPLREHILESHVVDDSETVGFTHMPIPPDCVPGPEPAQALELMWTFLRRSYREDGWLMSNRYLSKTDQMMCATTSEHHVAIFDTFWSHVAPNASTMPRGRFRTLLMRLTGADRNERIARYFDALLDLYVVPAPEDAYGLGLPYYVATDSLTLTLKLWHGELDLVESNNYHMVALERSFGTICERISELAMLIMVVPDSHFDSNVNDARIRGLRRLLLRESGVAVMLGRLMEEVHGPGRDEYGKAPTKHLMAPLYALAVTRNPSTARQYKADFEAMVRRVWALMEDHGKIYSSVSLAKALHELVESIINKEG